MTNLMRRLGYMVLLSLAACTPAKDNKIPSLQALETYRQMLRFNLIAAVDTVPVWKGAPAQLRHKLALCTTDLALAGVESAQMNGLDAYARDPAKLPLSLRQETVAREEEAMARLTNDDFAPLAANCKEDVALFRKYVE